MFKKDNPKVIKDMSPGFYSSLFLIKKMTSSWMPAFDFSLVNKYFHQMKLKMATVASVLSLIRNLVVCLNPKNAYIQILIHQLLRKHLYSGRSDLPIQCAMLHITLLNIYLGLCEYP